MKFCSIAAALLVVSCGGNALQGARVQNADHNAKVVSLGQSAEVTPPPVLAAAPPSGLAAVVTAPNLEGSFDVLAAMTKNSHVGAFTQMILDRGLHDFESTHTVDRKRPMAMLLIESDAHDTRAVLAFTPSGTAPKSKASSEQGAEGTDGAEETKCLPIGVDADLRMVCSSHELTPQEASYAAEQVRRIKPGHTLNVQVMLSRFIEFANRETFDGAEKTLAKYMFGVAADTRAVEFALDVQAGVGVQTSAALTLAKQESMVGKAITSVGTDPKPGSALAAFPDDTAAGLTSAGGSPDAFALLRRALLTDLRASPDLPTDPQELRVVNMMLDMADKSLLQGGPFALGWSVDLAALTRARKASRWQARSEAERGALMVRLEDPTRNVFDTAKQLASLAILAGKGKAGSSKLAVAPKSAALGQVDQVHFIKQEIDRSPVHIFATHQGDATFLTISHSSDYAIGRMKRLLTPGKQTLGPKISEVLARALPPTRSVGFVMPRAIAEMQRELQLAPSVLSAPILVTDEVTEEAGAKTVQMKLWVAEQTVQDVATLIISGFQAFKTAATAPVPPPRAQPKKP